MTMAESSPVSPFTVSIVQRVSPAYFEAVWEYCSPLTQDQSYSFFDLERDINEHYNTYECDDDWMGENYAPNRGELVAVCHPTDEKWYRAKMGPIVETTKGYRASVHLVDMNRKARVPQQRIRKLHEKFCAYPPKGCTLELLGLVPCTLQYNADTLSADHRPAEKWATHAYTFVDSLLKEADEILFTILGISSETFLGKLHFRSGLEVKCLNDLLVKEKYALLEETHHDDAQSTASTLQPQSSCRLKHVEVMQNENSKMSRISKFGAATPVEREKSATVHFSPTMGKLESRCSPDHVSSGVQEKIKTSFPASRPTRNEHPKNEVSSLIALAPCSDQQSEEYSLPKLPRSGTVRRIDDQWMPSGVSPDSTGSALPPKLRYKPESPICGDDDSASEVPVVAVARGLSKSRNQPSRKRSPSELLKKLRLSPSPIAVPSSDCQEQNRPASSNQSSSDKPYQMMAAIRCFSPMSLSKDGIRSPSSNGDEATAVVASPKPPLSCQRDPIKEVQQWLTNVELQMPPTRTTREDLSPSQAKNPFHSLREDLSPTQTKNPVTSLREGLSLTQAKNSFASLKAENVRVRQPFGRGQPLKKHLSRVNPSVHQNIPGQQIPKSSEIAETVQEAVRNEPDEGEAVKHISTHRFYVTPPTTPNFSTSMDDPLGLGKKSLRKILVCGQNSPKPIREILKASFNSNILHYLKSSKIYHPATIQAYVWPAVMRGRNVAVVSGPRSGKTFSYLLPIFSFILDNVVYDNVPSGNEPLALILCAYWQSAAQVYEACTKILHRCKTVRVLLVHGGGYDETRQIQLINGCDILIATPCALLRLLRGDGIKPTGLNRLCHFILDEIDILAEEFTPELKELIDEYTSVLKSRKSSSIPCQIMTFGCKWTSGVKSFIHNVMINPLFYCSSFCESIVFAGIKTVAHAFSRKDRAEKIIEFLQPNLNSNDSKIVICTTSSKLAKDLHHSLSYACKFKNVKLATEDLSPSEVFRIAESWRATHPKGQQPILIAMDGCLDELNIEDADCLIHYDIPRLSKSTFGLRFICLLKHMQRVSITEKQSESESACITHIITTSDCILQAHGLIQLLKRLSSEIPSPLLSLALGYYQGGEERKEPLPLCSNIKAFGCCSNQYWCTERHIILPVSEKPSSLISRGAGIVLFVTDVRNATWYFARIVRFQKADGNWQQVQPAFLTLNSDMAAHFAERSHRIPHLFPLVGDMCAIVGKDDGFYRAKVLKKPYVDELSQSRMVSVLLVDLGKICSVEVTELLNLPENLASYPPQAVEVYLCNLQPADKDIAWTQKACIMVNDLICEHEVIGKVALCLGSTIWLSTLVKHTKLRLVGECVTEFDLQQKLISGRFAIKNPKHVTSLERLASETFPLPSPMETPQIVHLTDLENALNPEFAFLPLEQEETIQVSCLPNPGKFFVVKVLSHSSLENLMDELENYKKENPKPVQRVVSGMYCISIFPQDDSFYRGRVIEILPNTADPSSCDSVRMFYVDYGDEAIVKATDVYPLQRKHVWKLPFQAIECSLADVVPMLDSGWTDEASEFMWKTAHNVDGSKKSLTIKALRKSPGLGVGGAPSYEVQLYDTTSVGALCGIDFADWLCAFSHAWRLEPQDKAESEARDEASVQCKDDESDTMSIATDNSDNLTDGIGKNGGRQLPNVEKSSRQPSLPTPIWPTCVWSDTKENVTLQIRIAGVKHDELTVMSNQLHYKTVVEPNHYELNVYMYDEIDCYTRDTRESYVCVRLKKKKQEKWPRFLKEKIKTLWLSLDFDKLIYSSDEEEDIPSRIDWHEGKDKPKKEVKHELRCGPDVADADILSSDESDSNGSEDSLLSETKDHFDLF